MSEPVKWVNERGKVKWQPMLNDGRRPWRSKSGDVVWMRNQGPVSSVPALHPKGRAKRIAWIMEYRLARHSWEEVE